MNGVGRGIMSLMEFFPGFRRLNGFWDKSLTVDPEALCVRLFNVRSGATYGESDAFGYGL